MFDYMMALYEAREYSLGACGYTEVVMVLQGITFEAMIHGSPHGFSSQEHQRFLQHFGLNSRQFPIVQLSTRMIWHHDETADLFELAPPNV